MELKEYINLFRTHIRWFWITLFLFVFVAFVWQKNQSTHFEATLLLNIGRTNIQNTEQYTYDSFYRLQADERFADTVVRWLGSPRIVENIYQGVGLDTHSLSTRTLKGVFVPKRLSSQMIEVTYENANEKKLRGISQMMLTELNQYTKTLNEDSGEKNWFIVIGSDPVIRDVRFSLAFALAIGCALGVFFGFWMTLVGHYFSNDKK